MQRRSDANCERTGVGEVAPDIAQVGVKGSSSLKKAAPFLYMRKLSRAQHRINSKTLFSDK